MLCYLNPHFTNIPILNATIIITPPLRNGKISTSKHLSVFTLTPPSVTSINDKVHPLQNPIHDKINYLDLSKNQARSVHCASNVMKTYIKLLSHKP